jgi:hypothetical protein
MKDKVTRFATENPKLATFIATNVALTGFPVLLFLAFTTAILVFSMIAASLFTLLMAGVALLILLPTVLFTTSAASFLWASLFSGYYLLASMRDQTGNRGQQNTRQIPSSDNVNKVKEGNRKALEAFKNLHNQGMAVKSRFLNEPSTPEGPKSTERNVPSAAHSDDDTSPSEMLDEMKKTGNPYGLLNATNAPPPSYS